ncbi:MAG: heme ABC transporter ATP-binding protein [Pseudomonadota bacterium]
MTVELEQASVIRSRRHILNAADLVCEPGEVTVLIGPNGAGKSTALQVLAGVTACNGGRCLFQGDAIERLSRAELARRRGVVAQTSQLGFPFQVHEVVSMGRTPHYGYPRARNDAAVMNAVMDQMDIFELASRNYLTLSGGERQRVNIARVLAQLFDHPSTEVPWLFLDEPTAALDLKHQIELMKLLEQLAAKGWGLVVVLHDLRLVRDHADKVVLFRSGSVIGAGSKSQWLTPEMIQNTFDLEAPYDLGPAD